MNKFIYLAIFVCATILLHKEVMAQQKPKMKILGIYDGGQPNVSIIKLLDPTDDVLCYVLMPDNASRKEIERGKWTYDGNSVGSISCLKVMLPVVPVK